MYADIGPFTKTTMPQDIHDETVNDTGLRVEYAEVRQRSNFDVTVSDISETSAVRKPGQLQSHFIV